MRKIHWLIIFFILLIPLSGILFYPYMPQKMGTHWGFDKTPDGYMDKFNGVFLTALICAIPLIILLIMNIAASIRLEKTTKSISLLFLDGFTIILSVFLSTVYIAVLLWNYGVDFNVPIFMFISVGILLVSILILFLFLANKQKTISASDNNCCSFSDGKYKDSLIEISSNEIFFKNYYFPIGSKRVKLSEVEYVQEKQPTLASGKWRLHGTGDLLFRIWFPADYNRPSRDKIFVMKIKGKWTRVGFTVENSCAVSQFFRTRELLQD